MPISEIVAPCLSIGPKPSLIIEVSIMAFVLNIVNMPIILGKVKGMSYQDRSDFNGIFPFRISWKDISFRMKYN